VLEETTKVEWLLLGFAWLAMVWPMWQVQAAGFAAGLLVLFLQWNRRRAMRAQAQEG
jgi:hypothetical protein